MSETWSDFRAYFTEKSIMLNECLSTLVIKANFLNIIERSCRRRYKSEFHKELYLQRDTKVVVVEFKIHIVENWTVRKSSSRPTA